MKIKVAIFVSPILQVDILAYALLTTATLPFDMCDVCSKATVGLWTNVSHVADAVELARTHGYSTLLISFVSQTIVDLCCCIMYVVEYRI